MVLRSSPWESRTSLTNKGHFARKLEEPGPLRAGLPVCLPQFKPSVGAAFSVSVHVMGIRLLSALRGRWQTVPNGSSP